MNPAAQLTPEDGAIEYLRQEFLRQHSAREDVKEFLTQRQHVLLVEEEEKFNLEALRFRDMADYCFAVKRHEEALSWYSRSLCFAEEETKEMGLAYAGRAEVYFEMGEYEYALDNLEMARESDHPDEDELWNLRVKCKQQIAKGKSKETVPAVRMDVKDRNPKIPFLACGIKVDQQGAMVAEKDFKPGDVIMDVEPLLTVIDFNICHEYCNHCGIKFCNNLIPCPSCVHFMYCSEECQQNSWKLWHRFECPVATKLRNFSASVTLDIERLFLYGLSLFDDNLPEMKQFCESNEGAETNRFQLDFSNLDQRELFRILHNTKPESDPDGESNGYLKERLIAFGYYLVFRSNPALAKIIEDHRDFTIQTLFNYARSISTLHSTKDHFIYWIFPGKPALALNCDPNAMISFESYHLKTVLLRPVQTGQPIVLSTSEPWWSSTTRKPAQNCPCAACNSGWTELEDDQLPTQMVQDYNATCKVYKDANASDAAKLNALQGFIERNAHVHPAKAVGRSLAHYQYWLNKAIFDERIILDRAKVKAMN